MRSEVPGADPGVVGPYLAGALGDPGWADCTVEVVAGGRSNLTYVVTSPAGEVVLRRPPLRAVRPTAHDMAREHRIIGALADSAVPVPRALALCTDASVNGTPFYAMSFVDGLVVRADLTGLDDSARHQLAATMMAVLADLHEVDVEAAGLADFGRPEGFMGRQLTRWSKQLDASRSRELPGIDRLRDDLAANLPPSQGSGIVHGDYRLDNLVVAPPGAADALAVRAVLDWEMATLGDPLADLGLLLAYWDVMSELDSSVVVNVGASQGFPSSATLTAWYRARRDVDLGPLPWYKAFGLFKLAVILEGIHYRYQLGQTVGDDFAQIGSAVPALVTAGRDTLAAAHLS